MVPAYMVALIVILIFANVALLALYISAKNSIPQGGYDPESKSSLTTRVTSLKEKMQNEDVDMNWLHDYIQE